MFLPALSPHQRRANAVLPSEARLSPLRVEETGETPTGQPQNKRAILTFTVTQANTLALSFHLLPGHFGNTNDACHASIYDFYCVEG